jgi:peptidoglycan-associated lipoprotein
MSDSRSSRTAVLFLLLLAFGSFSCKHKVAAAPPVSPSPAAAVPVRAADPPTITLRADRPAVTRGQSATLTVSTQNATSVTIEPGLGTVPVNGIRQVTPTSSVTYVATATGPGGTAGDSVRLTVNEPPPPTATPTRAASTRGAPAPPTMDQQIQQAMQTILFDYDKADVRPDQMSKLQTASAFLKQNPNLRFTVEGHCDERGSEEYNLALGDRRANAIKQYLIGQGIAESRLSSVSYGEERPVCREQTEACYQSNRRGSFTRIP